MFSGRLWKQIDHDPNAGKVLHAVVDVRHSRSPTLYLYHFNSKCANLNSDEPSRAVRKKQALRFSSMLMSVDRRGNEGEVKYG